MESNDISDRRTEPSQKELSKKNPLCAIAGFSTSCADFWALTRNTLGMLESSSNLSVLNLNVGVEGVSSGTLIPAPHLRPFEAGNVKEGWSR